MITETSQKPKKVPKQKLPPKKKINPSNLPPPPISPKTAFQSLPIRRSPRFSSISNSTPSEPTNPTAAQPINHNQTMFIRKIPKTIARRKGLSLITPTLLEHGVELGVSGATRIRSGKRKMTFNEEEFDQNEEDKDKVSFHNDKDARIFRY